MATPGLLLLLLASPSLSTTSGTLARRAACSSALEAAASVTRTRDENALELLPPPPRRSAPERRRSAPAWLPPELKVTVLPALGALLPKDLAVLRLRLATACGRAGGVARGARAVVAIAGFRPGGFSRRVPLARLLGALMIVIPTEEKAVARASGSLVSTDKYPPTPIKYQNAL